MAHSVKHARFPSNGADTEHDGWSIRPALCFFPAQSREKTIAPFASPRGPETTIAVDNGHAVSNPIEMTEQTDRLSAAQNMGFARSPVLWCPMNDNWDFLDKHGMNRLMVTGCG